MDNFLKRHKLPKITQEEKGNTNKPLSIKETEFTAYKLFSKKTPGPNGFTGEFDQTHKA